MKTNQVMIRKMGNYDVFQRTKDGYFDANSLLRQWNSDPEHSQRKMEAFLTSPNTKEFIQAIIHEENNKSGMADFGDFREDNNCQICPKIDYQVVKRSKVKEEGKAGRPLEQVWMHPLLFIDFAMWINPTFKVKVLKFVYDEMIKYRHEAGEEYRRLGSAIQNIVHADFMQTAMRKIGEALNWVVFNSHEAGLRNLHGDAEKQRELSLLERKIADLISDGFLNEYNQVLGYLRKLYNAKNYPKVFIKAS